MFDEGYIVWINQINKQVEEGVISRHGQIVVDAIKSSRCECNKCNFCKDPERFYFALERYVHFKRAKHIYSEILNTDFPWADKNDIIEEMPYLLLQLIVRNPTNQFYSTILDYNCDSYRLYQTMIYYADEYYKMKPCESCIRRFNPTGKTKYFGLDLEAIKELPKNRLQDKPLI